MKNNKMRGISLIEQPENRTNCWFVRLMRSGVTHTASFAFKKHGGKRKALEKAQKHYQKLVKTVGIAAMLLAPILSWASREVTIGWDPNAETNIIAYRVYYWVSTNEVFIETASTNTVADALGAQACAQTLTNLSGDATYSIAVSAVSADMFESELSDILILPPRPRKPTGVMVLDVKNTTSVIIQWKDWPFKIPQ